MNYSDFSPKDFAEYLGTKYSLIKFFYYDRDIRSHYKEFEIEKKSGGVRVISAPSEQLANIQRKIAEFLARIYSPRNCVKAFRVGASIKDNAALHVKKTFVFNVDLENFFNSVSFYRVRGLLQSRPYGFSYETSTLIAHLVTCNGVLPQGAPSSPVLSNMICSRLDGELLRLAKRCRATYSRYADDITFSFLGPAECVSERIVKLDGNCWRYSHVAAEPGDDLRSIIESNGFSICEHKTRMQPKSRRQVVTGLTVNKKVNVDRKYIRKTSAIMHSIELYGVEEAQARYELAGYSSDTSVLSHLRGRLLFIYQIKGFEDGVYRKLAVRFNCLPSSKRVPLAKIGYRPPSMQKRMLSRCWVLEECDKVCSQATGFLVSDNLLMTCAHFFTKEGEFEDFVAFRSGDSNTYKATLVFKCDHRDLAIARFQGDMPSSGDAFSIEDMNDCSPHDRVTIWGFPNYKPGSDGVSCIYARVTQTGVVSGVNYAEVDKLILAGNSGGPVLDKDSVLVGVAYHGASSPEYHNAFLSKDAVLSFWQEFRARHSGHF